MNCGPNEISNLDLKGNYDKNINTWKEEIYSSTKKMFDLAQNSLKNNPNLKKVVLVKRPPRFDSKIAAHLSEFGNNILDDLWMRRNGPKNIVISKQVLESSDFDLIQSYGHVTRFLQCSICAI